MKGNSEGVELMAHIHEVPNPPCPHHSLLPCRRETPIEVGRQGSALSQKRVPTHGAFFQDLCRSPVLSQPWPWQFRAAEALDFSGSHRGSVGIRAGCAAPQKIWFGTWGLSCGRERFPHGCVGWRNEYLASKIPLESRPRTVASPTRAWAARRTVRALLSANSPISRLHTRPQEAAGVALFFSRSLQPGCSRLTLPVGSGCPVPCDLSLLSFWHPLKPWVPSRSHSPIRSLWDFRRYTAYCLGIVSRWGKPFIAKCLGCEALGTCGAPCARSPLPWCVWQVLLGAGPPMVVTVPAQRAVNWKINAGPLPAVRCWHLRWRCLLSLQSKQFWKNSDKPVLQLCSRSANGRK